MIYECCGGKYYKVYYEYAHKKHETTRSKWEKAVEYLQSEFDKIGIAHENLASQFPLSRSDRKYYHDLEQLITQSTSGGTLKDAVDFYLLHRKKDSFKPQKVVYCTQSFIDQKKTNNVSLSHIETIEKHYKRFNAAFGNRKIHEIETLEISEWLHSCRDPKTKKKWGSKTKTSVLGSLVSLSLYARDYLNAIPEGKGRTEFQKVHRPKPDERLEVEIYSPLELKTILDGAAKYDPDLIPIIVLGAFQGLRPSEAHGEGVNRKRLQWDAFNWEKSILSIRGQKVRSRRTRKLPIMEATVKWLKPFLNRKGNIWKYQEAHTKKLVSLRDKIGVKAVDNGWRHSYASYRIITLEDKLNILAKEMGNSPNEIIDSYKENVLKAESEAWFSVFPEEDYEETVKNSMALN